MTTPQKILMIDDDSFFTSIIAAAFKKNGFEVLSATSGPTGLEIARSEKPNLVLLDLAMAGTDGYATLKGLKADPATAHAPVVILSSLNADEEIERARVSGAADFLVKMNHTPEQLVTRVKELLA